MSSCVMANAVGSTLATREKAIKIAIIMAIMEIILFLFMASDLQIIADGIYASERSDQDSDPQIGKEKRKHHPMERNEC